MDILLSMECSIILSLRSFSKLVKRIMIRMKKNWVRLMAIAGCAICLASCKNAPDAAVQMPMTYKLMTVETTNKAFNTSYSAAVRGRYDASILPQVSGTIWKVMVKEGQRVHKGQSLFVIDQVPYRAALEQAVANVAAAEASLATAKLTYESKQALFEKKVVSDFDLRTAENAYLSAKAGLAQAKALELNARNNYSYTEVKSPANGVVGTLPYRVGALVSPSGMPQPLTTVSDN